MLFKRCRVHACVCACEDAWLGVGLGAVGAACPLLFVCLSSREDVPHCSGPSEACRARFRVANSVSSVLEGGAAENGGRKSCLKGPLPVGSPLSRGPCEARSLSFRDLDS